ASSRAGDPERAVRPTRRRKASGMCQVGGRQAEWQSRVTRWALDLAIRRTDMGLMVPHKQFGDIRHAQTSRSRIAYDRRTLLRTCGNWPTAPELLYGIRKQVGHWRIS